MAFTRRVRHSHQTSGNTVSELAGFLVIFFLFIWDTSHVDAPKFFYRAFCDAAMCTFLRGRPMQGFWIVKVREQSRAREQEQEHKAARLFFIFIFPLLPPLLSTYRRRGVE